MRIRVAHIALLLLLPAAGCRKAKRINPNVTLSRVDKNPYGARFFYASLDEYFPEAELRTTRAAPDPESFGNDWYTEDAASDSTMRPALSVSLHLGMFGQDKDVLNLVRFVERGNYALLSTTSLDDTLEKALGVEIRGDDFSDSMVLQSRDPAAEEFRSFPYPGFGSYGHFTKFDTARTTVLGRNDDSSANFIRIRQGRGVFFVQLAPLGLSNFFLLHKRNVRYLDDLMAYLPRHPTRVIWDEYFGRYNGSGFSVLNFVWRNAPLRWALWLIVGLFVVLFVFESKRRQRLVPVVRPPSNASLEFVRTVGQLYFQQKNNTNLAEKMVARFLDTVRTRLNLSGDPGSGDWTSALQHRAGLTPDTALVLAAAVRDARDGATFSDGDLMALEKHLALFYKQL